MEGSSPIGAEHGWPASSEEGVFTALYPALRRFAAVVAPVEVDPDDLVQEALVRTLARGPLTGLDDPGAYLRLVMVRLAANERRAFGRRRRALGRLAAQEPVRVAEYPSDLAALDALSTTDRAVIYLSVVEGASAAEVAEVVGGSSAAARMRLSRALRRLRSLEQQGGA